MISVLLNASLTYDGDGYCRRLQLAFAEGKGKVHRHPCDAITIFPGMTRGEVAAALRTAADRIEHHETGLVSGND